MKVDVIKRDGTLEPYDESKIVKIAEAAGLENGQAQAAAVAVSQWIKTNSLSKITSLQIRDVLIGELKKLNKSAADLFLWYEDSKDNHNNP